MKKAFLIVISLVFFLALHAQDEEYGYRNRDEFKTIFGGRSLGGYGSLGIGYTLIEDRPGVSFDARGGVVLGHSFAVGVGGVGFINTEEFVPSITADVSLTGGYGGIFGEFIVLPRSQVHLSFPILAGMGAMAATSWTQVNTDVNYESVVEQVSIFMIVEPSVELEFNFTRFFRMAGFFSYRFTTDIDMDREFASAGSLINYTAGLRFKFGKF
jgi:hypothetical protein